MGKRLVIKGADFSENGLAQEMEMTAANILENAGFFEPMRGVNCTEIEDYSENPPEWISWWIDLSKFGISYKFTTDTDYATGYSIYFFDELDNPTVGERYDISAGIFTINNTHELIVTTNRKYMSLNMIPNHAITSGYDIQTAYEAGEFLTAWLTGQNFLNVTNIF